MKKKISAMLLAALVSAPAFADSAGSNYAGVQIARATFDASGLDDLHPTVLVGRIGHHFAKHFSLEGRVGIGLSDDSTRVGIGKIEAEIDHFFGVYGLAHLPVNETFSVYALAGFTAGEATVKARSPFGSVSDSEDESDFSYGVGGQINLKNNVALTLEYVSYLDKSDFEVTALSAGLNFKF